MKENEEVDNFGYEQLFAIIGEIASLFHQLIPVEHTIAVTDTDNYTHFYKSEGISQPDLSGNSVPSQGFIPSALVTGVLQRGATPKEMYGVEMKTSTIPFKDGEDNSIGTISLSLCLDTQEQEHKEPQVQVQPQYQEPAKLEIKGKDELLEATQSISSSSQQLSTTSKEIVSSAALLSNNVSEVFEETQGIIKLIEQTNNILDFVNNVAANSRLLGLNAAIEAARAGESGKGFAVVAEEIRKMAENSAKSVNDTKEILSAINNKVNNLLKQINELSEVAKIQAAVTKEITSTVNELASSAQTVQKISKSI